MNSKEEQLNQRLMAEFEYDIVNNNKPSKGRPPRPGSDLKQRMSRRYPELADDSYVQSMKDTIPLAPLTLAQQLEELERQKNLSAMSANTNVQRLDPDLLNREELDELDLLK